MSLLSRIRGLLSVAVPAWRVLEMDAPNLVMGFTPGELYRTQPNLRTVINFRAQNVAQLGVQCFERVSDTDRRRVTDSPVAELLKRPNPRQTTYDLFESLVSDLDLYDSAYWLVVPDPDSPSGWMIQPIPPAWVSGVEMADAFSVARFLVNPPNAGTVKVEASDVLAFHGWNPDSPVKGSPTVDALRDVLAEQVEAWRFRLQMWKRGGRVGSYISRPAATQEWSDAAREKFTRGWSEFQSSGARAGSTPVLEDGMELKRVGFSAHEEDWVDAAKLSLQMVASAFHVNPVMVGQLDEANFASTREFRKMLYSETLGPLLKMIEDRLNTFLVPLVDPDSHIYVEFNIASKLAGDFEEQASVLSTLVGRPILSLDEGRAKLNYSAVEGGDAIITPLNVTVGGQASPQDGGTPPLAVSQQSAGAVVESWKARMARSVPAKRAAGLPVDWDRWGAELVSDLKAAGVEDVQARSMAAEGVAAAAKNMEVVR